MVILIALATFVATLVGGLVALQLKDKLHLVLGFSAGAVLGVAFFDLLPESLNLAGKFFAPSSVTALVALGFALYLVLDRSIYLHAHSDEDGGHHSRGVLGAGSLSFHSLLDGLAIGLAFQVSAAIGTVVAAAVLVHDFSDGVNTVGLVLKNKGDRASALRWLFVDALAPVVGAIATLFFTLPEQVLGIVLALFTGFFLYIGASDLIPESHHGHPKILTTVMTILGMAVLYGVIHFAGI